MAAERFAEIESLRGLAIALVVAHHSVGLVNGNGPPNWDLPRSVEALLLAGHTGVSLFFVLSGFLLSRPFLAEARGGPRVRRLGYAERRFLRVMPLYVLAVVVAVLVTTRHPGDMWRAVPYLFFLNAWPNAAAGIWPHSDPWWSLATEAQFYVLLPLLPLALRSRRGRRVGLALLLGYVTLFVALAMWWLRPPSLDAARALAQSVVGRAPHFFAGIAAAAWYERRGSGAARDGVGRRITADVVLVAAFASLLVCLEWAVRNPGPALDFSWPTWRVAEALAWGTVVLILVETRGFLRPLLVNRAWGFLGLISYSLYLVHFPLFWHGRLVVNRLFPMAFPWLPGGPPGWTSRSVVATGALVLVAIAVATLTYAVVERPLLKLKRQVSR